MSEYYSGTAVYTKTFDNPQAVREAAKGGRIWLDLGTVRDTRRGLGSTAATSASSGAIPGGSRSPMRSAAKANRLEIHVANLWPNRLIGDEREPPDAPNTPREATWPAGPIGS